MKALLLVLISFCSFLFSKEAEGINLDPESVDEEILLIRNQMKDHEDLLRDDRVGEVVQNSGREIVEALDKLIKEIEDAKETNKEPKGKALAERWRKLRALAGIGRGRGRAAPRKIDSERIHEGDGYTSDRWAKLSKEMRDVILQDYKEEIPVRWKSRIEAYFMSIAAEVNITPKK